MQFKPNFDEPTFMDFMQAAETQMMSSSEQGLIRIIDDIAKYDVFDFMARVSALNLLLPNQNKNLLFAVVIAGVLSRERQAYSSTIKMSNGKFRSIINRLGNLSLSQMVDPAENLFVERVRYYGNYWIFPGTNFSPAYSLQGFLDALCLRKLPFDAKFRKKIHQLINFVLNISNNIAQCLNYDINTNEHIEQRAIVFPDTALYEKMRNCICLDDLFVEEMIEDPEIRKGLFIDFAGKDISEIVCDDNQEFFRQPFLRANDNTIILLDPTILVSFLIHKIVILAETYGYKELLINAYNEEIWNNCRRDLRKLGHKKIDEKAYGIQLINNQHRKEEILTVGNDKLLFVHFVCDAGDEYDNDSMFAKHIIKDGIASLCERAKHFENNLPMANEENIYQLVVLNAFGRTVGCETSYKEMKHALVLTPQELHCVSVNESDRQEFLPRYINAKKKLNMMLPPMMSSELNNIEIYRSSDYSFYISDDYDPKTMTAFFGFGDSLDYVIRATKKENRHLIDSYDGEHLTEVVLNDPIRNIYFSEGKGKAFPELVVKFEKVNVWFTTGEITRSEEADLYYSIIDAMSYWMAEAKDIINKMDFEGQTLRIHVLLESPVERYYQPMEKVNTFVETIQYHHEGNTITILWKPETYQLLGVKTNSTEKEMLWSVLNELGKIGGAQIRQEELDGLFDNPLKKKAFEINVVNTPYMRPTSGNVPVIPAEEEHQLLDEVGAYFLAMPEYDYGRVPNEKRAKLTNEVVGYLYKMLQEELASVNPTGLFEKVCFDLETVMNQSMLSRARYAYDIACYPEKADKFFEMHNSANRASVALKFLAEYIAAVPPTGKRILGLMQYDRLLAICSLIIDWAYKNDLFVYHIFDTPVSFLKSGRIGMPRGEGDYLAQINSTAYARRMESLSDPNIPVYFPSEPYADFNKLIDEAFVDEYGYTFQQFGACILALADYGEEISGEVKKAQRTIVVKQIAEKQNIDENIVSAIVDQISLCKRDDFLSPPKPFSKHDVYPWRFNRELSFTRRPVLQHNNDLIWGNRQLHHMLRYTVDLIMLGKYKARSKKLKQLIGKLSDLRGNEFNTVVYKRISAIDGLIVREKVSKINGKKIADENGNVLGDIDVLYIVPDKKMIVVGEVKDFSFSKNPYEMDQEYKRIFVDGDKPCYMTKHKRRAQWVNTHIDDVIAHFKLHKGKWSVKTVMFTSEEIVSNAFYHKGEKIIVYSQITEKNIKAI